FLNAAPTPFHAVQVMADKLLDAGFKELHEENQWNTEPGKYFVTRNQSSIIAFNLGSTELPKSGIRIVGAHTDSPCLKAKPRPNRNKLGYHQIGVEVYGGVLLNPWFDRDLSLAGRVTHKSTEGKLQNTLIDLKKPIAIIPSLAIHLDREANNNRKVNPETDMAPVLLQSEADYSLEELIAPHINDHEILATELSFYDTNPAAVIGERDQFLASARLDNLLSCFTGLTSLVEADNNHTNLLVCNDHEEVGSASFSGAEGTFLRDVLERITNPGEDRRRTFARSLLISTDNAHGIHPNYPDKHESNHGPILNKGPTVKFNANQRYATNSETAGDFKALCQSVDVPIQEFVNRADMACGSTIGPITAKEIGVKTLDVGVPTFAMHSIRELAGTEDAYNLMLALKALYCDGGPLGASN
ncbi:MAG TPA: M18 family aminopeptidase, partial [Gammaproteobacteria bacterium]|nr:M18 family aminopeptidase [Gammaproteobacteria bacterium]